VIVAWTVHLQHEGKALSFLIDVIEVPEVSLPFNFIIYISDSVKVAHGGNPRPGIPGHAGGPQHPNQGARCLLPFVVLFDFIIRYSASPETTQPTTIHKLPVLANLIVISTSATMSVASPTPSNYQSRHSSALSAGIPQKKRPLLKNPLLTTSLILRMLVNMATTIPTMRNS
jgi:hypothetical protein